jgi:hypothetical protein
MDMNTETTATKPAGFPKKDTPRIPRDGGKGHHASQRNVRENERRQLAGLQFASPSNGGRRFAMYDFAMYDQVLVSVFLGAACLVVYLEFLRETAVHEKPATRHD